MKFCRLPSFAFAVSASLALSAVAQVKPADPSPATEAKPVDPATVELSPFEIVSDNNRGYYAPNSMSGTRMNTKLEDLASAMTVMTKEQMQDFAMLDINDVFLYTASAEGTGTFTDMTVDRNGSVSDNVQTNPTQANRVRGIASANVSLGNFETMGRVPIDPLAIDAVEISRGPNSSVFGLGNPSGTVNQVAASANLIRNRVQTQVRGDSYDGYRTTVDINQVLLKGKLAIRGTAAFQHDGFVRKPSGFDTERYNLMVKYAPFKSTTITAGVEFYHSYGSRANAVTPRDNISYWRQSGSPTWDPVAQVVHVNGTTLGPFTTATGLPDYFTTGLFGIAAGQLYIDRSGLNYWAGPTTYATTATGLSPINAAQSVRLVQTTAATGITTGGKPTNQPLFTTTPTVSDKSIYDWTSINLASVNYDWDRVITSNFAVNQHFFTTERQTLDGQVAFMREDALRYRRDYVGSANSQGQSGQIFVDVDEKRLDGTPNPFFLHPYIGQFQPQTEYTPAKWDSYRAQLAYQLDLTKEKGWLKWLGRQQLSGFSEYKYRVNRRIDYRDGILDNHGWTAVAQNAALNAQNNPPNVARTYLRYYLGDGNGSNVDYGPKDYSFGKYPFVYGSYPTTPNPPVAGSGTFNTEQAVLGLAASTTNSGGTNNSKTILKATGWILQSHFLDEHIVTTFGQREDKQYQKYGFSAQGGFPNTQQMVNADGTTFNWASFNSWQGGDYRYNSGKTSQGGAVVRPFRGFGFVNDLSKTNTAGNWLGKVMNGLSLTYNRSDNFRPQDQRYDINLRPLPNPSGTGKDYGFWLDLDDGRFVLRVNRWTTVQHNKSGGDAGTIAQRMIREDIPNSTNQSYILTNQATAWVTAVNPDFTSDQVAAEVARQTGISTDRLNGLLTNFNNISSTQDVSGKGTEIELNFNPTKNWTVAGSVTDTQSIQTNVSSELGVYLAQRLAVWTTIKDQRTGLNWWTTNYGGTQTAQQNYASYLDSPYNVIKQQEGKANPQVRRYAARVSTNFRLAAITERPFWRSLNVGGAIRWEDKGAIGYYGVQQLPAVITDLDVNRPIYDKSNLGGGVRGNYYFDGVIGYRTRLWSNKVGATFQLNVRNIQEDGHLQAVAALPDGTPSAYRIVDPRQFILSATFDL